MTSTVWSSLVGQDRVVERLRDLASNRTHAYLFIGPEGCGKEQAARAFASRLITGSDALDNRDAELITRGGHPDVIEVLREGAAVDKDEADNVIRLATTTPTEGPLKVVIIHETHLMRDTAAVRLLKTIEEPSNTVAFILLADQLVPSLATINSRCVVVSFPRIDDVVIENILLGEGLSADTARSIALIAGGNLDRARILANDPLVVARSEAFASVPHRLDGTGATVMAIVDELLQHVEQATEALAIQQAKELAALEERVAITGERGSGRKALQDQHKRQMRKFRTDELRSGLAKLAATYHQLILGSPNGSDADRYQAAISKITKVISSLALNANEQLAIQALLLQCPSAQMAAAFEPVE
jgi:DNA polymerase-3 subunit delta'